MSAIPRFVPPGPVAARFQQSRARIRMIMGPFGSGKTSVCLFEMAVIAAAQRPSPVDGVSRAKFAVIRDTYRNLRNTTIPSWFTWFPKATGHWSGDEPSTHTLRWRFPNGRQVELIVEFIALGEHRIEDVMRGWEGTGAYINEADRLSIDVLTYVSGRLDRYPAAVHGGPTWSGVWLDMNAPDTENWTYDFFVENPPDGVEFFQQPDGMSAQAENTANLTPGYYDKLAIGKPEWWIRRYIRNQWGYSREGKPVYPEFNDALHVAGSPLEPDRGLPLLIGLDAGLSPAAEIVQHRPNGQWRVLAELVPEAGTGPNRFGGELAQLLKDRFAGMAVSGLADPSAAFGADRKDGEQDWIQIVAAKTGFRVRSAPTNALTPRLEAVRVPLTRMIDGHVPGLLVSPSCKILRKGFNSGYRYRRRNILAEERYDAKPDKNEFSHPHDALQYALGGGGEHHEIMGRKAAQSIGLQTQAIDDDHPRGGYLAEGGASPGGRRRRAPGYQTEAIE